MRLLGVLLAVLALAGCVSRTGAPLDAGAGGETAAESDSECEFVRAPDQDAPAGLPPEEPVEGEEVTLTTGDGDIVVDVLPEAAPCTVQSFLHLAKEQFFDGNECHRITTSASLKILQCGDPIGDGTGGPGYTIPDELPTGLEPAPDATGQEIVIYPRGTVAMANAGANTGGSQFFLVYGDSSIQPNYSVFGTLDRNGLAALDRIAARGLTPTNSPEDGAPRTAVVIVSATIG